MSSYRQSYSAKEFIKNIDSRIRTSKKVSQYKKIPIHIKAATYESSMFIASAELEEYLKNIFQDWLLLLSKNNKKMECLPPELQAWITASSQQHFFKHYYLKGDEQHLIEQISKSKPHCVYNQSTPIKDILELRGAVGDRKYPSQKNINILFYRFGIKNVFNELQKDSHYNFSFKFQSFSDIRTELAHEHYSSNLTLKHVDDYLTFLKKFVRAIDRLAFKRLSKFGGKGCWRQKQNSSK